jgi:hypothetical protein
MTKRSMPLSGGARQPTGKSGVVYILSNSGLNPRLLKIGCSRHSGNKRARELNAAANTGTPAEFVCAFEATALDCRRAEQLVFQELSTHRRGKRGQEFFEVELQHAIRVIQKACNQASHETFRNIVQTDLPPRSPRPVPWK